MRAIIATLFATVICTEIFASQASRAERSVSERSFEEKLEEGYQLLKDEKNADDTKSLLEKLHNMREEIKAELISSSKKDGKLLNDVKNYAKSKRDHTQPDTIEEINEQNKINVALFEGDMILTKDQADEVMDDVGHGDGGERTKRQAHRNASRLWPDKTLYYSFSEGARAATKRVFKKAVDAWSEDTCIEFKEDSNAPDQVVVRETLGCSSRVGRMGGKQSMSLGQLCESIGHNAHEIAHALGLFHTQSRPDRNSYIKIITENIAEDLLTEFVVRSEKYATTYNLTYDYGSVMHYSATSSSKNGDPVMMPNDVNYLYTLGSPMISFYDKLLMNIHYGCLDQCSKKPICHNGGFRHPRSCSKCVCPSGYGGKHCDERPSGCGEVLVAKVWTQSLTDAVGRSVYDPGHHNDEFIMCNYWIKAPTGSVIEVKLEDYSKDVSYDGCKYAGVEIKTGSDKRLTGYRFCDDRNAGTALNSTFTIVPIITYSRLGKKTTVLSYRIVSSDPKTKCKDNFLCKLLLKAKPCKPTYNGNVRRKLCPKTCGFCL